MIKITSRFIQSDSNNTIEVNTFSNGGNYSTDIISYEKPSSSSDKTTKHHDFSNFEKANSTHDEIVSDLVSNREMNSQ